MKELKLTGNQITLHTPYNQEEVNALKATIPTAKWDKLNKHWTIPLRQHQQAIQFAHTWNINVDEQLQQLQLPQHPHATTTITLEKNKLKINTPYNQLQIAHLKSIPGVQWNPTTNTWETPYTTIHDIIKWADQHNLPFPQTLRTQAQNETQQAQHAQNLNQATDADIHIPTLQIELYPYQKAGVAYAAEKRKTFIADQMGLGKACILSTMILTPTGWTTHGEVKVNDLVIGSDGKPTKVVAVHPQGTTRVLRVEFTDGTHVDVNPEHLWNVQDVNARKCNGPWKTLTTQQMYEGGQQKNEGFSHLTQTTRGYTYETYYQKPNGDCRWYIPIVQPVQMESQPTPIDPYLLGCLLGDGSLAHHSVQLTTADTWMIDHIRTKGYTINKLSSKYAYGFTGLLPHTRQLGIQGHTAETKFVPTTYLHNDIETRLNVLQGLMDTDGYISKTGTTQFTTISQQLAEDVTFLVQSLGGVARTTTKIPSYTYKGEKRQGQLAYTLTINIPTNPFKLPRKAHKHDSKTVKYPPTRGIKNITEQPPQKTLCITVDAPNHLYVIQHCIVTHNSIQALATTEHTNQYPALIICPTSLTEDWKTKIQQALPHRTTQTIEGRKTPPQTQTDYTIIGYPNIHHHKQHLTNQNHNTLILDESHYCKNPDAQRTKAAKQIAKTIPQTGNILLLTGTPITNMPAEYAPQLEILGHIEQFGGKWNFYKRYCGAYRDNWGHWQTHGATNQQELLQKLQTICYIRREKQHVLPDLPPITYNTIHTTMDKKHRTMYNHALNDLQNWYTQQQEQQAIQNGTNPTAARIRAHHATQNHETLIQLTELRKIVAQSKIPHALEWTQNANTQNQKIVIAAHHRHIIQTLANELNAPTIIGGQHPKQTEQAKHQFQNNPNTKNIIISIDAAAHGHTLTAANNLLFIEAPWTPAKYHQTCARIHRIGQTQPATIHNLINPNTIDQHIYNTLQNKTQKTQPAITHTQIQNILNTKP